MASAAAQVRPLRERQFYSGIALAMAAVTFIGFAPTYYLTGLNDGDTPLLTTHLHMHGALCTAWIVLLIVQTQLIAAGQRAVHKILGLGSVAIAAATFVSGIYVALASERRIHSTTTADTIADPYVFLIFPMTGVCLFAIFVLLGVLYRHRPDIHKRLMLLATMNLIGPALARIVTQIVTGVGIAGLPGAIGALLLIDIFIAALVIHDLAARGRLHPATLWGGGFILLSEPLRIVVGYSEPWQSFARMLMG